MAKNQWSGIPSQNDMVNYFQTGMLPSSVKTAGWDIQADQVSEMNTAAVGGTANAITAANLRPFTALPTAAQIAAGTFPAIEQWVTPSSANTGAVTFAPDGLTVKNVLVFGQPLSGGELQPNVPAHFKWDGTQWNLQNPCTYNAPSISRNFFVDPCCRSYQGLQNPALSTARQYATDLAQVWASGGAVTGGSLLQGTTVGATGNSAKASNITLTGAGAVSCRRFIESKDVNGLIGSSDILNPKMTFACMVRQDTGAPINYTITLNYANAANNFGGGVTLIGTSANISVPSGVDTQISFTAAPALVQVNGIEMIVAAACGAVAGKNFDFTDFDAYIGAGNRKCAVPQFDTDLHAAQRYFEKSYDYSVGIGAVSSVGIEMSQSAGTTWEAGIRFKVPKVAAPTLQIYSPNSGVSGKIYNATGAADVAATLSNIGQNGAVYTTTAAAVDNVIYEAHWWADARL